MVLNISQQTLPPEMNTTVLLKIGHALAFARFLLKFIVNCVQ